MKLHKALIPAAGLGTRMFPATKVCQKELLPVITPQGKAVPLMMTILEEASNAGCDELALIVGKDSRADFERLLTPCSDALYSRLPDAQKEEENKLRRWEGKITYLVQEEQKGFGHAVNCAREWAGSDPVLLLLGDHLFCNTAKELVKYYEQAPDSAWAAFSPLPMEQLSHYGVATGAWLDSHSIQVQKLVEKPSTAQAEAELGLAPFDQTVQEKVFLCIYGQYVLTPELFAILQRQIQDNLLVKGEYQLTPALQELARQNKLKGLVLNQAPRYDLGQPKAYLESLFRFAKLI